jgi:hypothetical protein
VERIGGKKLEPEEERYYKAGAEEIEKMIKAIK